jgi:hypothetical protein
MNPPTIGHAKLVDAVKSQGGDPYIFLSQSQKPKTDPLAFADKLRYAKFFFPEVTIGNPEVKTIIQALQKIDALGYDNLIYVAGSDRVASFEELINKYNGVEYNFKSIKVVSAGERDPDADGAEGMSASKMRAAAAENDLESFAQGVPNQEVADEMFAAVRQGMGVKDSVAAEDVSPEDEDKFHTEVDRLIHKYFGHSSDEKKKEKKTDEGWFDFSGKEMKDYIAYATRFVSIQPEKIVMKKLMTKFPEIKPVDAKRAVKKAISLKTEDAPPGREKQVKALKKEFPDDEGAPYAIAWAQHNKKKKRK